jgi:hypothetical protein
MNIQERFELYVKMIKDYLNFPASAYESVKRLSLLLNENCLTNQQVEEAQTILEWARRKDI